MRLTTVSHLLRVKNELFLSSHKDVAGAQLQQKTLVCRSHFPRMFQFSPQWHCYGNHWIADAVCPSTFLTNWLRCHSVKSWVNLSSSLLKTSPQCLKHRPQNSDFDFWIGYSANVFVLLSITVCKCHSLDCQHWTIVFMIGCVISKISFDMEFQRHWRSVPEFRPCILPEKSPLLALSTTKNQRSHTALNSSVKFTPWIM